MNGILEPQDTCWRVARSPRAAFLLDTEAYFTAVFDALRRARRSVLLLGWGFDPRARLFPDGSNEPDGPDQVGRVLIDLAQARPDVDIRLLIWRSALPISASQEFFPHKARAWFAGTSVKFRLDDSVPFGACHHQKVLVVDDSLAFCGSGDISVDRWDTTAHLDGDRRRIMPDHESHPPRHEVMMMVEGEAARTLGDLARDRWRHATGEVLTPVEPAAKTLWPRNVPAHISQAKIGVARSLPAWRGQPAVYEARRLDLAAIRSARFLIYLENQYFASPVVCEALAARLAEPDGPQVVLVSTGRSPSWFDQLTMDRARSNMLWRLRAADVFGRFRSYYPTTRLGQRIIVHAKTCVVDDRFIRVGSSNLNNRSGGFDTECDLAVEAEDHVSCLAVSAFRDRSVGHFIAQTGEAVARASREFGGLIGAIDHLDRERRLQPLNPMKLSPLGEFVATWHLGDPLGAGDSWKIARRRKLLYAETRAMDEGGPFRSRDWADPFGTPDLSPPRNPSPGADDPKRLVSPE